MSESGKTVLIERRLVVLALSSLLVALPQIMWSIFGYRGATLIILDCVLVIAGFFLILIALLTPAPPILKKLGEFLFERRKKMDPGQKAYRSYISLLMIPYVLVPMGISRVSGSSYPSLWAVFLFAALTVVAIGFLMRFHSIEKPGSNIHITYYMAVLGFLGLVWVFAFWYGTTAIPTDESGLDLYSAHLLLNGLNPYAPANTANVFSFLSSRLNGTLTSIATPYSTGGFVTSLAYPALAVFAYLPANILNFNPSATFIPLYAIFPLIVYWGYTKYNSRALAIVPVFLILLDPSYLIQVGLGYPDILWVIFTTLSIAFYKKPAASGILMGLSIAVKQIPWLLIPFLIIFVYREVGKRASLQWTVTALGTFLLVNILFIVWSPADFFGALFAPEIQSLVGIGFGPSQLAFLDILPLPRVFFSYMVIAVFISSVVVYFGYYNHLKYAFLAFPVIIFLFNYRLLLPYVLFWPFIAYLLPPIIEGEEARNVSSVKDSKPVRHPNIRKFVIPVFVIVLLSAPAAYSLVESPANTQVQINSLATTGILDHNVTQMNVMLSVRSGNISAGNLQFRIMPSSPVTNMNGYLWKTSNCTPTTNGTYDFVITPLDSSQQINWNGDYRLVAYYGSTIGGKLFKLESGKVV